MQILIVEDEEKIANFLRRGFTEESYVADIAVSGVEALYKFEINAYDCIILDLMIPIGDGLSVCRAIRKKNASIPILILTAKDAIEDRVTGLDAGADDYLTKPFAYTELSARLRALIRRGKKADPVILRIDNLILDPATRMAQRDDQMIVLTTREYALLEYLMRHQNNVITKTELLEHVWDYNYNGLSNIVETYIKYLRKKIQVKKTDKELIHTMRGSGYILKIQ
ncbi:MAG: response regulator transcription factor [Candidatus Levyibacteriota bacterium]